MPNKKINMKKKRAGQLRGATPREIETDPNEKKNCNGRKKNDEETFRKRPANYLRDNRHVTTGTQQWGGVG